MPFSFLSPGRSGAAFLFCFLAGCGARTSLAVDAPEELPSRVQIPAPRFDCRVSDSPRPMLAARVGPALHFAYPDRSAQQVFTFDVPEGSYVTQADVIARGDHVAAYAIVKAKGGKDEPPPFAEVVVLHVDGTVLYHERHDFAYDGWGSDSQLTGNASGLFVLTLMEVKADLGLVIEGSEGRTFEERIAGRSDPDSRGTMAVWDAESPSSADYHFFDTEAGTITPSTYISKDPFEDLASSPAVLASGILYIERSPARLVFEDASGIAELPIDVTLDGSGHANPGYQASGGYILFMLGGVTELDARYLSTRFATGETREFRLSPPAGSSIPGDFWNPPPIDASGRVLVPFSGDQRVHLHATRDGTAWEPVGRPIAASGYPTTIRVVGETVIFDGHGGGMMVPGTLPSWAAQLVGPQGGEGIELVRNDPDAPDNPLYADDEISGDGGCVAYFRSGSLRVIEVADYNASDLGLPADGQSAEMAWIPLPE